MQNFFLYMRLPSAFRFWLVDVSFTWVTLNLGSMEAPHMQLFLIARGIVFSKLRIPVVEVFVKEANLFFP